MADITITAANVVAVAGASLVSAYALATITAGQVVYRDATTGNFGLADNNGATATRVPVGIALHGASANQPLTILTAGSITIGGTLTAGIAYYLSDTPGGICPVADITSGETSTVLGIATSTSVLKVDINPSGVTI
jgi:hypothetical protein